MEKLSILMGFTEKVWTMADIRQHISSNLVRYMLALKKEDIALDKGYINVDYDGRVCFSYEYPVEMESYFDEWTRPWYLVLDCLEGTFTMDLDNCVWELVK